MDFTTEDQTKIKDWIQSRTPNLRCFCCGNQRWQILPRAAMTSMFDTHTGRIYYMDGYPTVALLCEQCGHIVSFSAPVMGLKPEPPATTTPTT